MVTKQQLDDAVSSLSDSFKTMLSHSIDELKNTIIENLKKSNDMLQIKVKDLQNDVANLQNEVASLKEANIEITKRTETAFQHGRLNQLIISGIPEVIGHDQLEEKCIVVLNSIKDNKINERDIAACHRLGKKNDTIIRFLNRKDAEDCLDNRKKTPEF